MRLFIAVNFDDNVKQQIISLQEQLRARSVRGNFSRPENLHVTLAFLGETPEEKLPALLNIIDSVQTPPFEIIFDHTGCFRRVSRHHSRAGELWWLGVQPHTAGFAELTAIQKQLVHSLEAEHFYVDKKPFNAHITLAREIISHSPIILNCPPIPVKVEHISLMKSEHIHGVLTYTEIKRS